MKKKKTIAIFTLAICASVLQTNADELPADGIELRRQYEAALGKETVELTRAYLSKLKKLLDGHTKAGRLDAAIGIRNEIRKREQQRVNTSSAYIFLAGDTLLWCPQGLKTGLLELGSKGVTKHLEYAPWNKDGATWQDGATWRCPAPGTLEIARKKTGKVHTYRQLPGKLLFEGKDFDGKRLIRIAIVSSG